MAPQMDKRRRSTPQVELGALACAGHGASSPAAHASAPSKTAARTASTTPTDGDAPVPARRKTPKRRAAEAALASRTAVALEADCSSPPTAKRVRVEPRALAVPACRAGCCCASHACARWCSFDVALPDTDWPGVLAAADQVAAEAGKGSPPHFSMAGVAVHVVEAEAQLRPALDALRESMQDAVCAIDLEWRPDFTRGSNRVALMQLASSSVAVLIRTHRMLRLHPALEAFLRDPAHLLLGFSWDGGDEGKLQASFGLGRAAFPRFLDLQQVAACLGWHELGLAGLARRVLGCAPAKARKVTMSDWEAARLSGRQATYAALDALLAGGVLRALRLWHAAPPECAGCPLPLGAAAPPRLACRGCGKRFAGVAGMLSHAGATGHAAAMRLCEACGRLSSRD